MDLPVWPNLYNGVFLAIWLVHGLSRGLTYDGLSSFNLNVPESLPYARGF